MRIGFDLDGVLYDFTDGFKRSIPHRYRDGAADRWNFFTEWGITLEEFALYCVQGIRNRILYWTGYPLPDAVEAIKALKAQGHTIVIITHRGNFGEGETLAREATEYWLKSHGIPFDELHLAEDKTSVPTDFMIEDKVENFLALRAAGCQAWLRDQAWNHHHETPYRAMTLWDFVQAIEEFARELAPKPIDS